jgi:putative transposase
MAKRRWTFRCYPTPDQERVLGRTYGAVRFVWNWALRVRSDGFRCGERIGYPETGRMLTLLKQQPETAWLNEIFSVPTQQVLRDLQTAFSAFFDKRVAYPSFKKRTGYASAEYTTNGFRFDRTTRTLSVAKLGALKVKWSRRSIPEPSTIRIIQKPSGAYFVSLVVDVPEVHLDKTGQEVGLDFGVARLATLSTGEVIPNPKYGAHYAKRMAWAQRQLARKQKGSKRRAAWKKRIVRLHEKVANCRADRFNKLALDLVRRFDMIHVEDLHLRGMVRNRRLARSLSDAAIGQAIRKIEEKAEATGKRVSKIDRFYPSSKMCSTCGHILKELPLSVRSWTCPECGARHDRDVNAAINILAVGQTVTAHGGTVRRPRAKAPGRKSRRSANRQGSERHA